MERHSSDAARIWSRYWAAGHDHSCPTSFEGFYGSALQAFWSRQCDGLTAQDYVLDLGCGNGALLRFLQARFPMGASPQFHGVDAAALHPRGLADFPNTITLHPRTSFRALPLPTASVSLAASQFGLEYDDSDETWVELLRVLAPASRVAFVMHKQGSRLDRVAADDSTVASQALASGLFERALDVVPYMARAGCEAGRAGLARDRAAGEVRDAFNVAADAVRGLGGMLQHGDYAHEILRRVAAALEAATAGGTAQAARALLDLRQRVEDHLARLAALRSSALGPDGLRRVRERLLTAGFVLADATVLAEQGNEMGWTVEGRR